MLLLTQRARKARQALVSKRMLSRYRRDTRQQGILLVQPLLTPAMMSGTRLLGTIIVGSAYRGVWLLKVVLSIR